MRNSKTEFVSMVNPYLLFLEGKPTPKLLPLVTKHETIKILIASIFRLDV